MTSRKLPCEQVATTLDVGIADENGFFYMLQTCGHEWADLVRELFTDDMGSDQI